MDAAKPTRAVAYLRVSTQEQAVEGVSLEAQEARVRAYATLRGLDLVDVVTDAGVSGGTPFGARPGGSRVLAAVAVGAVAAVVVVKLDRAFRDAVDCLSVTRDWDARAVALHVIDMGGNAIDTHSAAGRFMLTVLAGAAEMEKNLIGERTAAALQHLKSKGVRLGRAALGWERLEEIDASGRRIVVPLEDEVEVVRRIREMRAGNWSLREIAAALTAGGVQTKRGGAWGPETVRKVLGRQDAPAPVPVPEGP